MQGFRIGFVPSFLNLFLQEQKNLTPPGRPRSASFFAICVKCGAVKTASHCKFDSLKKKKEERKKENKIWSEQLSEWNSSDAAYCIRVNPNRCLEPHGMKGKLIITHTVVGTYMLMSLFAVYFLCGKVEECSCLSAS